jgi:hypothetical protein
MDRYYAAYEPDLRFYPNYSFGLASLTGVGPSRSMIPWSSNTS